MEKFGVKYVGQEHAEYLINTIKKHYEVSEYCEGKLYCITTLDWNYKAKTLDISMPGYIEKLLLTFKHMKPNKPQHSPYRAPQNIYGAAAQDLIPDDMTQKLDDKIIRVVQQVVGGVLYYARAVDPTVLV